MDIPIFSLNDTVLLVGSLQCLLMSVILLFIRSIDFKSRLLLSLFLFSLGADFLDTLMYWAQPLKLRFLSGQLYSFYLLKPVGLLAPPALYLYIRSVLYSDFRAGWLDGLHFCPALGVALLLPFYIAVRDVDFFVSAKHDYDTLFYDPPFQLYVFLRNVIYMSYGVLSYRLLLAYQRRLKQGFSNIERIDPVWLRILVVGFLGVWSLYALSYLSNLLFGAQYLANISGLTGNYLNVLFITTLVMYGLSQSKTFLMVSENSDISLSKRQGEREEELLAQRMDAAMREKELYLDAELSLEGLSQCLGVSSKVVSSVINRRLEKNFFEYVNDFRVQKAEALITADKPGDSMLQVMTMSGFKSKSTFNRCFKRATGKTPSEYRKSLKRECRGPDVEPEKVQ